MRILKWRGKLVEEVAHSNGKVVHLKILRDEDKDICPHCNKPIPTEINILEGCPNWESDVRGVETMKNTEYKSALGTI